MTRDDIIGMAREAGFSTLLPSEHVNGAGGVYCGDDEISEMLARFAELVSAAVDNKYKWDIHSCGPTCSKVACVRTRKAVEAEREACARRLDELGNDHCAAAIRARGKG